MAAKATQDASKIRRFVPCHKSYMAVLTKTDNPNVVCASADQMIMWLFWGEVQFSWTYDFR
jgi:hypothetical protein